MSDVDHDEEFDKAFEGFGEDDKPATPPVTDPATPPAEPPKADPPAPAEEPKKDDQPPAEPPKKDEEATPPTTDAPKTEEGAEPPKAPETPPVTEEAKPLTLDDIKGVISEVRTEERISGQALDTATQEVLEAYYPEGLSDVLTDTNGKQLKTPQDVVEASNGQMTTDEAAQWLINEQFKLSQDINKIKEDAKKIAETTLKFKQDGTTVLQRYEPLFKQYPKLQQKVWDTYQPLVKADKDKNVILSAPDMLDFYDAFLEPYRMAMELGQQQPATAPTTPAAPATPPPATPSADDRLDEGGDGGNTKPDDPNDFAQQVGKELAKGI